MSAFVDPNSFEGEAYAAIWMRCPYHADLCGAEASFVPDEVQVDEFELSGSLVCANGHRWSLVKLGDEDGGSET
jgi:hypothetical protein